MKNSDSTMKIIDAIIWWPAELVKELPHGGIRFIGNILAPIFGIGTMIITMPLLIVLMLICTVQDMWDESK